ncbi:MAG: hypothetical protein QNJ97_13775 [Myxococcota bacterium]|nr:hypothetical protein [Myxococcota bacterium]
MKTIYRCALLACAMLSACQSAEEAFVQDRLIDLCDDAYWVCGVPSGCILKEDRYVTGTFPGTRSVVIATESAETELRVRLFFSEMVSSGTEFLIQAYEPNCTLNPDLARVHLVDVDIFERAGEDRKLTYDLSVSGEGEHLLELYSDASAEYLLIVETD